ncbi:MAG: ATP-binding protein [Methanomassiliicoccaceae archaeon]|nr:ATP-binding protein [Methanomassiliicoccaceae archaeon]
MFIGREKEMEILNRRYASGKFEFLTIYGRRRVGKTALIREFCKDKKTIFFPAIETDARNNLDLLSMAIYACTDPNSTARPPFERFYQAFDYIAEFAEKEKIVFVIDEFPYLAESERSLMSVLQQMIDHKFQNMDMMLILCGSSMSFMEHQVHGYKSPLYGRRTGQIKLLPFRYSDMTKWFPSYTPEDLTLVYAAVGGIPTYLREFSEGKTVRQNILDALMGSDALLIEEPSNLLKQEMREPKIYNAIITAVAVGRTKLSEISAAVGMDTGSVTKYIDNLISIGIIKKEVPLLSENKKKTVYLVADNFFRFWYRFVPPNMGPILSGRMPEAFDVAVAPRLPEFMGLVFEDICKEFLMYNDHCNPFIITRIGQWWGGDPVTKEQRQIDLVALPHDDREVIVGSCKYRNEPASLSALDRLKEDAEAMGGRFKRTYYYIFSKSGFSSSLIDMARSDGQIRLISLDELYGRHLS